MTIYFVRHGQTDSSGGDAISHDDTLNQAGIDQAREVAKQLKDVHFNAIISSTKKRAIRTAEAINTYHDLSIALDDRWRERELDVYVSMQEWDESFDFENTRTKKGIEPLTDFFQRVYAAIDNLKQNNNEKTVLIASHGGVHHALYAYANKLPLQGNVRISRLSYCDYRVYEI